MDRVIAPAPRTCQPPAGQAAAPHGHASTPRPHAAAPQARVAAPAISPSGSETSTPPAAAETGTPLAETGVPLADTGTPLADTGTAIPDTQAFPPVPAGSPALAGELPPYRAWRSTHALRASLAADPRVPAWIRRAVVSAIVGAATALAAGWWLGIAAASVTIVAGAFYSSRTSVVVPASIRAASAQRRTRRRLTRLTATGHLSLHGRLIPGTGLVVEHLVVGPAGVYAVQSQHWDRRLPVRPTRAGGLFHGPFDETGSLERARLQAERLASGIGGALGEPVPVRPAIVIYGPHVPWPLMRIAGVDVLPGRKLRRYLRRETSASRATALPERRIELIHAIAAQLLPPAR